MEESDYVDSVPDIYPAKAQINSKYTDNGFVEIFLPYEQGDDDNIMEVICPNFMPTKKVGLMSDNSGLNLEFSIDGAHEVKVIKGSNDYQTKSSLVCLQQTWRITLEDSILSDLNYFLFSKNNSYGLKTIIDVENMTRGQHHLIFEKKRLGYGIVSQQTDSLYFEKVEYIPFWIE